MQHSRRTLIHSALVATALLAGGTALSLSYGFGASL